MTEKDNGMPEQGVSPREIISSHGETRRQLAGDVAERTEELKRRLAALADARSVSQAALDLEVSL